MSFDGFTVEAVECMLASPDSLPDFLVAETVLQPFANLVMQLPCFQIEHIANRDYRMLLLNPNRSELQP